MKSKKAIKYLKEQVFDADALVNNDVDRAEGMRLDAIIAIERAEAEIREELLRWRDPKEEVPENGEWVLIKSNHPMLPYTIAMYLNSTWRIWGTILWDDIIAWRPIQ